MDHVEITQKREQLLMALRCQKPHKFTLQKQKCPPKKTENNTLCIFHWIIKQNNNSYYFKCAILSPQTGNL